MHFPVSQDFLLSLHRQHLRRRFVDVLLRKIRRRFQVFRRSIGGDSPAPFIVVRGCSGGSRCILFRLGYVIVERRNYPILFAILLPPHHLNMTLPPIKGSFSSFFMAVSASFRIFAASEPEITVLVFAVLVFLLCATFTG